MGGRDGGAAMPAVNRVLLRAVLLVAALLALVLLAGAARRALDLPAATPVVAIGIVWLIGFVMILGWIALLAVSAYRDRGAER